MKDWVKEYLRNALARVWSWTYFTGNSADGTKDSVASDKTDSNAPSFSARRMQHFGFRSLPPSGVAAIRLGNIGAASNSVIIAEESSRFGPSDLKDGEVAIYNKVTGCVIKMDQNGAVSVTGAPNQNITVSASGTGSVAVSATPVTGAVKLGPVGNLAVLVQGTVDSLGVPVTQNPAASATIVKAG